MPFVKETILNPDGSVKYHAGAGISDEEYAALGEPSEDGTPPTVAATEAPRQNVRFGPNPNKGKTKAKAKSTQNEVAE